MIKKIAFAVQVIWMFALCACHQHTAEQKAMAPSTDTKTVNIKLSELASKKDFACGMTLEEGSVGDTASYDGKLYGFCSEECKANFLKNPQSYLEQK